MKCLCNSGLKYKKCCESKEMFVTSRMVSNVFGNLNDKSKFADKTKILPKAELSKDPQPLDPLATYWVPDKAGWASDGIFTPLKQYVGFSLMHVITESVRDGFKSKRDFEEIYKDSKNLIESSILDGAGFLAYTLHRVETIETTLPEEEINQRLFALDDFASYWTEENMGKSYSGYQEQFKDFLLFLKEKCNT